MITYLKKLFGHDTSATENRLQSLEDEAEMIAEDYMEAENEKIRAKGRELADQLAYDVMVGLIVHNDAHPATAARTAFSASFEFWDKYCLHNEIV